jgi:hypothetical protein
LKNKLLERRKEIETNEAKSKKEWVGRVFILGTQFKEAPKEVNGVLGSYVKFYGDSEKHGALPIVVDKSAAVLPEGEIEIAFEEAYLVPDKVRISSRETNDDGRMINSVNGYLDFSLYLSNATVKEGA